MKRAIRWLLAAALLCCAAPAGRAAEPLVIGFDIELTGGLAPNGKAALQASRGFLRLMARLLPRTAARSPRRFRLH